jgi:hypothetical protein
MVVRVLVVLHANAANAATTTIAVVIAVTTIVVATVANRFHPFSHNTIHTHFRRTLLCL